MPSPAAAASPRDSGAAPVPVVVASAVRPTSLNCSASDLRPRATTSTSAAVLRTHTTPPALALMSRRFSVSVSSPTMASRSSCPETLRSMMSPDPTFHAATVPSEKSNFSTPWYALPEAAGRRGLRGCLSEGRRDGGDRDGALAPRLARFGVPSLTVTRPSPLSAALGAPARSASPQRMSAGVGGSAEDGVAGNLSRRRGAIEFATRAGSWHVMSISHTTTTPSQSPDARRPAPFSARQSASLLCSSKARERSTLGAPTPGCTATPAAPDAAASVHTERARDQPTDSRW
eukprot:scaffold392_cov101-Isochrysis_galbana.AAC.14